MNEAGAILQQIGALSYFGILGVSFFANIVVPVPEEIVVLAIGYATGTGDLHFWIALPIVFIGALTSDFIMFWLSRRNNKLVNWFYEKFFARIVPVDQKFIESHIVKIIIVARFLVQLRFLGPFLAGRSKVSWQKFLAYDALALAVYAASLMWAGNYFANRIEMIFQGVNQVKNIIIIFGGIVVIWSIGQMMKKIFLGEYVIAFRRDPKKHGKMVFPMVHKARKRVVKKKPKTTT